jgi:hypothetical protein
MKIQVRAALQTLKMFSFLLAFGLGFYLIFLFIGPRIGMLLIMLSLIGSFVWLVYDYYLNKFYWEEKSKN